MLFLAGGSTCPTVPPTGIVQFKRSLKHFPNFFKYRSKQHGSTGTWDTGQEGVFACMHHPPTSARHQQTANILLSQVYQWSKTQICPCCHQHQGFSSTQQHWSKVFSWRWNNHSSPPVWAWVKHSSTPKVSCQSWDLYVLTAECLWVKSRTHTHTHTLACSASNLGVATVPKRHRFLLCVEFEDPLSTYWSMVSSCFTCPAGCSAGSSLSFHGADRHPVGLCK